MSEFLESISALLSYRVVLLAAHFRWNKAMPINVRAERLVTRQQTLAMR